MRNYPSKNDRFMGRHFDLEIILLSVLWSLRYKRLYRDLVEMMAERGLSIAHTTILRRVQRYASAFDKRWGRSAASAGNLWRVDEIYVQICGRWVFLYRAVDESGTTVDFRRSPRRNVTSAKAFFGKAVRSQRRSPATITLDSYATSHRPFANLKSRKSFLT